MSIRADFGIVQFENANELRKYPFTDGSSFVDRIGRELPFGTISDVRLSVPHGVSNQTDGFSSSTVPTVRMRSVHLSSSMISVCFTSELNGTVHALSATVSPESFKPYEPVMLEKLDGSEGIGGIVSFGEIELPGFPITYMLDEAIVHPCCISLVKPPDLKCFYDPRSEERISGDVEIAFSGYIKQEKNGNSILLSLEDGADSELASECSKAGGFDACGATPIRSINGISPDSDGNIVLWFH